MLTDDFMMESEIGFSRLPRGGIRDEAAETTASSLLNDSRYAQWLGARWNNPRALDGLHARASRNLEAVRQLIEQRNGKKDRNEKESFVYGLLSSPQGQAKQAVWEAIATLDPSVTGRTLRLTLAECEHIVYYLRKRANAARSGQPLPDESATVPRPRLPQDEVDEAELDAWLEAKMQETARRLLDHSNRRDS